VTRRTKDDLELDKFKKYKPVVRTVDEDFGLYDTLEVVSTTITTAEIKVNTPESSGFFFIEHYEASEIVYVGSAGVTAATGLPLEANKKLELKYMKRNNNNEIYAICSTGSVKLYCVGVATA
jgi:hypothetical protein